MLPDRVSAICGKQPVEFLVVRIDQSLHPAVEAMDTAFVAAEQHVVTPTSLQCVLLPQAGAVVLHLHHVLEQLELLVGLPRLLFVRRVLHQAIPGGVRLTRVLSGEQLGEHYATPAAAVERRDRDVRKDGPHADHHCFGRQFFLWHILQMRMAAVWGDNPLVRPPRMAKGLV